MSPVECHYFEICIFPFDPIQKIKEKNIQPTISTTSDVTQKKLEKPYGISVTSDETIDILEKKGLAKANRSIGKIKRSTSKKHRTKTNTDTMSPEITTVRGADAFFTSEPKLILLLFLSLSGPPPVSIWRSQTPLDPYSPHQIFMPQFSYSSNPPYSHATTSYQHPVPVTTVRTDIFPSSPSATYYPMQPVV
ncbi:unnamed protein product [Didymodactylos carnosus]|uniref:Uncharacterized protein n=1 Tax=Didymodactylos carnosus TaxID=1234261 RepID=A0A815WKI3_9BILA|nr:unnamed protein product [Didymodactylos carnosus]CAF4409824.1 unnamed protein product [Didymodactylos carnosus]